jgi:hypothetical protein
MDEEMGKALIVVILLVGLLLIIGYVLFSRIGVMLP